MLELGSPQKDPPQSVLDAPGGFLWWYAELLDRDASNGLVVVWSFGLPFLPGYASADRAGRATTPRTRPSLNIVAYRDGREDLYVLHEFAKERAEWDGAGRWRFGDSSISLVEDRGERILELDLDCAFPGSDDRLQGRLRLAGRATHVADSGHGAQGFARSEHAWSPLMGPSFGTASIRAGDRYRFQVAGRGYFDRNHSTQALHRLGIARWLWGHFPLEDRERIFYVMWPAHGGPAEIRGFDVDGDGRITVKDDLVAHIPPDRTTLYGMPWWPTITLDDENGPWLKLHLEHRVDDGPFYLRFIANAEAQGQRGRGSCEVIVPDRIDLARHRPFVNMRVSSDGEAPSMWAPLFSGPRRGRVHRLVQHSMRGFEPISPSDDIPD